MTILITEIPDEQLFFYDKSGFETCSICIEPIYENDKIILKCNHTFHASCMMENVIKTNNTCPLCRTIISSKAEKIPNLNLETRRDLIASTIHDDINDFIKFFRETNGLSLKNKIKNIITSFGFSLSNNIYNWMNNDLSYEEDEEDDDGDDDDDDDDGDDDGNETETSSEFQDIYGNNMNGESSLLEESDEYINQYINEYINLHNIDINGCINIEDFYHLLRPHNLLDNFLRRLLQNDYFRNFENILCSDVETFMYPPGRNNTQEPYFTRTEGEQLLHAIMRYFTDLEIM